MKTISIILFSLLLVACQAGRSTADVQADRARWTTVRDVTVDGIINAPTEATMLADMLLAWDAKITAEEAAAGKPRDWHAYAAELARVYGTAAVQVALAEIGPKIKAQAPPELFRLVDKNSDGALSVDELLGVDPASPVFALVVATTAAQLLTKKH